MNASYASGNKKSAAPPPSLARSLTLVPRAEPAARDLPNPGYLNSPLRKLVWIALVAVGPVELAASNAPLALVFERLTGASPQTMSLIAIVATLNGIVVQIIMASRVLYGLASYREPPAILSKVDQKPARPLWQRRSRPRWFLCWHCWFHCTISLRSPRASRSLSLRPSTCLSHRHQASRHRLPEGGLRRANLDAMGRSRGVRPFAGAGRVDHPARMTQPRSFPLPPFDVDQGCSARKQGS